LDCFIIQTQVWKGHYGLSNFLLLDLNHNKFFSSKCQLRGLAQKSKTLFRHCDKHLKLAIFMSHWVIDRKSRKNLNSNLLFGQVALKFFLPRANLTLVFLDLVGICFSNEQVKMKSNLPRTSRRPGENIFESCKSMFWTFQIILRKGN